MHPVLGTMMPEICEAPHLLTSRFQSSFGSELNDGEAFISFVLALNTSAVQKSLCKQAFMGLSGAQYDV